MTVSLATFLAPAPRPQGGEQSGRQMNTDGKGFDDALAGASARKKPTLQGNDDHPRPVWTIGGQARSESADVRMPTAPVRVTLAGGEPRSDGGAAKASDDKASADGAQEQEPGETDTDATLALLGTMVGKETPSPTPHSSTDKGAIPAVKGSEGDRPADQEKAVDASPRVPPEPTKTSPAIVTTAAAPELSAAAARIGVTWGQAAERPAQQRALSSARAEAAQARTSPVTWAAAPATAATSQNAPSLSAARAETAQPKAPAGEDGRGQTARPDPRLASESAPQRARRQSQAQPADGLAGRVNVVGFNAAVAPAATSSQPLGATSAGLVAAIEADPAMRAAAQEAAAASAPRQNAPGGVVQSLRIQLNPAELGMVTARLTAHGQQLSVEIQAETADARQKLTNDSDAILKALRSVGYDVETVTIHHSAPAPASANVQAGTTGRDGFQPNQQPQSEGDAREQSDRGSPRGSNGEGQAHGAAEKAADRARGDIYI